MLFRILKLMAVVGVLGLWLCPAWGDEHVAGKSRAFLFTYSVTLTKLPPGQGADIWIPVPSSDRSQHVSIMKQQLPAEPQLGREESHGNQMMYLKAVAGPDGAIPLSITYRVTRFALGEEPASDLEKADQYLRADQMVPIGGAPLSLIKNQPIPGDEMQRAQMLYNVVDDHMQYRKDKPGWGRGDAVWACQSGFGNCTDFHSLFMSLARSEHLPAKFEIGFEVPAVHGSGAVAGYHCWAKFLPTGHGWVPVDISEANQHPELRSYYFGHLDENRVEFTTGRDLQLTPPQAGARLNFFIYPYVEVNGQPSGAGNMEKHFAYQDIDADQG